MLTAAVCVALSGAGLAVSLLTAWRRRFRRATRLAALSLLPVGLYLAGLITLGGKIGKAVGVWGADLVLKPTVWGGFAVIALAVLLYLASRLGRSREGGQERTAGDGDTLAAGSGRPAVAPARQAPAPATGAKRGKGSDPASEFDDVEAILRKHGI